jgi:hypothetical protein
VTHKMANGIQLEEQTGLHAILINADPRCVKKGVKGGVPSDSPLSQWRGGHHVFSAALANVLGVTPTYVRTLLGGRFKRFQSRVLLIKQGGARSSASWQQLLAAYASVKHRIDGASSIPKRSQGHIKSLTLIPLRVALAVVRGFTPARVSTQRLKAMEEFAAREAHVDDENSDETPDPLRPEPPEPGQKPMLGGAPAAVAVKREPGTGPASYLQFRTAMKGSRVMIDLTGDDWWLGGGGGGGGADGDDAVLAGLADNVLTHPPSTRDVQMQRSYRLADEQVSETLKEQCIRFGEWRTAMWEWSRENPRASATTVDGNVGNLLLFAGYATRHHAAATAGSGGGAGGAAGCGERVSPPTAFDLAVFSTRNVERLVVGYLDWLHRARGVRFSTIVGYLNSLVVMARFYFASEGLRAVSFNAGDQRDFVLAGLRRLRSHAHAEGLKEARQKPLHPQWLSWRECNRARRRAVVAYFRRTDRLELLALYKAVVQHRRTSSSGDRKSDDDDDDKDDDKDNDDDDGGGDGDSSGAGAAVAEAAWRAAAREKELRVLRHPRYAALKELVCLALHTVTPPVRVSIVRQLQFRSTFVKLRSDPSRYVIDLRNNPGSAAARHKTASYYRRGILPQAKTDRLTQLIDELRSFKLARLNPARWVFLNKQGQAFSPSAWTEFARRAWRAFASPKPSNPGPAVAGEQPRQPPRQPPPSLCRTIFVTWLNGVPHHKEDKAFAELQKDAARFQTHTLETANKLYDKDLLSYERLLRLTEFCEAWSATFSGGAGLAGGGDSQSGGLGDEWDENLDSDDERFDSTEAVARRRRAPAPAENPGSALEDLAPAPRIAAEADEPNPSQPRNASGAEGSLRTQGDTEELGLNFEPAPAKLYLPEAILEKNTQVLRRGKDSTKWRQWFLVKWHGYSVAESTWEPDVAFYEKNFPGLIHQYEQARVPEKLVGVKLHASPVISGVGNSSGRSALHYQVRWRGSEWTTMEPTDWVHAPSQRELFATLLEDFRRRKCTRDQNQRAREEGTRQRGEKAPFSPRQLARRQGAQRAAVPSTSLQTTNGETLDAMTAQLIDTTNGARKHELSKVQEQGPLIPWIGFRARK